MNGNRKSFFFCFLLFFLSIMHPTETMDYEKFPVDRIALNLLKLLHKACNPHIAVAHQSYAQQALKTLHVSKVIFSKLLSFCTSHPKVVLSSMALTFAVCALKKSGLLPITKHDLECLKLASYQKAKKLHTLFLQQNSSYTQLKTNELQSHINFCNEILEQLKTNITQVEKESSSLPHIVSKNLETLLIKEKNKYTYLLECACNEEENSLHTTHDTLATALSEHSGAIEKFLHTLMAKGLALHDILQKHAEDLSFLIDSELQRLNEISNNDLALSLQQQLESLSSELMHIQKLAQEGSFKKIEELVQGHEQYLNDLEMNK